MRNAKKSEIDITKLKALDNSITVTVGTGGNFSTITQAINYLMEYRPTKIRIKATIQLLAGFTMSEQVYLSSGDYSWIQTDSVDTEVVIDRTYIQSTYEEYISAFTYANGCKGPILNVLFNMNSLGTAANQNGLHVVNSSSSIILPAKGFKNSVGRNAMIRKCSTLLARQTIWVGGGGGQLIH